MFKLMLSILFSEEGKYYFANRVHEDLMTDAKTKGAKMMTCNLKITHLGYLNEKDVCKKNLRNIAFLKQELAKGEAHSLTYYHIINSYIVLAKHKKNDIKLYALAVTMVNECLKKFNLEKEDPLLPKLYALAGLASLHAGQSAAAKQWFHKAYDEFQHPEAAVNLADIYFVEGKIDTVIEMMEKLYNTKEFKIDNMPINLHEIECLMLHKLGDCYSIKYNEAKDIKQKEEYILKAEKMYNQYLNIEKGNILMWDRLVQLLRNTGRVNQAMPMIVTLVNKFPTYWLGWLYLADFEHIQKRSVTANIFYREAVRINPKCAEGKHMVDMIKKTKEKK